MPWKPSVPGERPSLGGAILDWIENYLTVVDGPSTGDPLRFTDEQAQLVLKLYEVDPNFSGDAIVGRTLNNGRLIRRAVLSRPKGWGKSPLVAALCIVEAIGPVVMSGWDANGQPVGMPWVETGIKPKVQIVAVSEDQTANTWEPCLDMVRSSEWLCDDYDVEPMETFINVPRGRLEAVTSAGISREGFRPVFTAMDQTESWTESNGGWKLARAIRRNLAKVNGCSMETPNAFLPGENTVAEASYATWRAQEEGRFTVGGLLFDHREAPPETDILDEDSLRAGLAVAYGESADVNGGWVNLDRIVAEFYDTDNPQDARRYYLNQITHAADQWIDTVAWGQVKATYLEPGETYDPANPFNVKPLEPGDAITIGFDGSRGRVRGNADATALIGCRIYDGHLFELGVWEAENVRDPNWEPPADEIDAAVKAAFRQYRVMAFYADPSGWVEHVVRWEKDFGRRLKVKCSAANPMMAWPRGKGTAVIEYVDRFKHAVLVSGQSRGEDGAIPEITHSGDKFLTRHVANARMRPHPRGYLIFKAYPESPAKIDAAYAAVMAYKARLDCVARGLGVRIAGASKGRMLVLE
ncbi:hypothetical protein [Mycolicibacterium fortuitum]|uniref:hypothetical protein n=1 Tax=Mycolicibacterium fortuitum TaxID=1766 RepID=UPI00262B9497|nr:hypothetical protein [Mycolicibacterium fortuitum]